MLKIYGVPFSAHTRKVLIAAIEKNLPFELVPVIPLQQSLYPADMAAHARALWIEEFVDSRLAPHVLRGLLMQRVFAPRFLQRAPDEALIRASLNEMIPPRLAYLERSLQGEYFAGTSFSVADIAVASILINFHYAGESVQEKSHPKLYKHLRQVLARDSFRKAFATEMPTARKIDGLDMSLFTSLGPIPI